MWTQFTTGKLIYWKEIFFPLPIDTDSLWLWTVAPATTLSMGFFLQEYWNRLPFPPPEDVPDSGVEPISPVSPALQADFLPSGPSGKPSDIWKEAYKIGDSRAFQVVLVVKNPPSNVGDLRDTGSIPGSGRFSGGCMAAHSSILAWRIPWTEVCQAQSMRLKRVRNIWSDLAHTSQGLIPSRYMIFSASSFPAPQVIWRMEITF